MAIISMDIEFDNEKVYNSSFESSISLLDYDVVLWDPSSTLYGYDSQTSSPTYMGYKNLTDNDSAQIVLDMVRRKNEINEVLDLGRTVVIFTSPPQKCYRATGEKQYSGTGKNRQTTRIINETDILDALPIKVKTVKAIGENIEFKGNEPFLSFWNSNSSSLYYEAYFEQPVGKPLFLIKGTEKVVGAYISVGNGHLVFLPSIVGAEAFKTKKEWKQMQKTFIDSLLLLIEGLKKETGDFEIPVWGNYYLLPKEANEKQLLHNLEVELNNLLEKISRQKEILARLEEHKILFTGSGKALEKVVGRIFDQLGFIVTEGLPGRDDLILEFGEKVAVVEVKGVSKSAAEKHAAQLEKWVSEYYASKAIMPKGILIVNAFKDMTLAKRTEEVFPNQMLRYSINRGHCLMSSIQLLGIYLSCNGETEKVHTAINKIFETAGVYEDFSDWRDFLYELENGVEIQVKGE